MEDAWFPALFTAIGAFMLFGLGIFWWRGEMPQKPGKPDILRAEQPVRFWLYAMMYLATAALWFAAAYFAG